MATAAGSAARWEIRRAGRIHSLNRAADTSFDHAQPAHGGLDGDAVEWTERLLEVTRYEVSRADEKANTLFRFYGVVAALSVGLLVGQGWSPSDLTASATVCFWAGVTCFLVSGVTLGMVLYPAKRGRANGDRLLYFGDVLEYSTTAALRAALQRVDGDVDSRLVDQLFVLSRIVDHKFRLTRGALLTLLAGTILTVAAVVLDAIFS